MGVTRSWEHSPQRGCACPWWGKRTAISPSKHSQRCMCVHTHTGCTATHRNLHVQRHTHTHTEATNQHRDLHVYTHTYRLYTNTQRLVCTHTYMDPGTHRETQTYTRHTLIYVHVDVARVYMCTHIRENIHAHEEEREESSHPNMRTRT